SVRVQLSRQTRGMKYSMNRNSLQRLAGPALGRGRFRWRADIVLVTLGDAKIDYRRHARACEGIIQTPVTSRHRAVPRARNFCLCLLPVTAQGGVMYF